MPKNVLITGATGFIGGHLSSACLLKGWQVRAFVLPDDAGARTLTDAGVDVRYGDIADALAVEHAADGTDIVFHCAGMVTDWAPEELFRKVMVTGTENVCRAALIAGARLVHISTNDVFGRIEGRTIMEDMPLRPWGEPYPDFKIKAEEIVWKFHRELDLQATMVYPCWVYGPGDRTFVPLLADAIVKKEMVYWRKDVLVWPTYVQNLVDVLLLISEKEEANGQGFLVHDGESTTLEKFCSRIAETMIVPAPWLRIPYPVAYAAALLMEWVWRTGRFKSRPLLTTYAVKNLGSRFSYSIDKAESLLNWKPKTTHSEGMNTTMRWLKDLDTSTLKQK
ncbi:MAG: NAD-dependent epimerase/dehydratase family protein [Flavobacteriales bacterium]|nr:NAD-dependent epimerase/dehydratase family protein [Flavobacteriales bacterium]